MKRKVKTIALFPLASALVTAMTVGAYALCFGGVDGSADEAVLSVGDRGADVAALQERLKLYGYYDGEVDGVYDVETSEAVRRFRLDEGRVDASGVGDLGEAGEYELYALGVTVDGAMREMRPGDKGGGVARLQRELRRLGYYSGEITGRYGLMTASAVRRWQGENGLRVTGVCDGQTAELLGLGGGVAARDEDGRVDILARLVESVGGDMDYRGQVAVAAEAIRRAAEEGRTLYAVSAAMVREMGEARLSDDAGAESKRAALDAVMGILNY